MATFTAAELAAASQESTPEYRGIVLAAAIAILQRKLDLSLARLARETHVEKHTLSNWRKARPIVHVYHFERSMEKLASALRAE